MPAVALPDLKLHVQAPASGSDDALLTRYGAAAEAHVATYLRRDMGVDFPTGWPADVQQAVQMLVADWYENRSLHDPDTSQAPQWFYKLLAGYRDMS